MNHIRNVENSFKAEGVIARQDSNPRPQDRTPSVLLFSNAAFRRLRSPLVGQRATKAHSFIDRYISSPGVGSNFGGSEGTGGGRSAQDTPKITFSEREAS